MVCRSPCSVYICISAAICYASKLPNLPVSGYLSSIKIVQIMRWKIRYPYPIMRAHCICCILGLFAFTSCHSGGQDKAKKRGSPVDSLKSYSHADFSIVTPPGWALSGATVQAMNSGHMLSFGGSPIRQNLMKRR